MQMDGICYRKKWAKSGVFPRAAGLHFSPAVSLPARRQERRRSILHFSAYPSDLGASALSLSAGRQVFRTNTLSKRWGEQRYRRDAEYIEIRREERHHSDRLAQPGVKSASGARGVVLAAFHGLRHHALIFRQDFAPKPRGNVGIGRFLRRRPALLDRLFQAR